MHAGVVVAGGRSTRFDGADKAVAELAGTPMIRRVADRIAGPVDELVVNCRADQRERIADALAGYPLPVTYALDDRPDEGPLAGLACGLRATDAERAFVVACDVPFVDPAFVRYLFDRAAAHEAAVPKPGGYREALHAVYRPDAAADAAVRALDSGERRAVALLDGLDVASVTAEEIDAHATTGSFESLNTRTAFDAAAERFEP
ncbi:molybdenum cofactor guanylyltransferase [Halarchaeum sp. CBA1220]|uniref:molybdenum cofactor guanylyltransferase n=1 Tax=Halarchaeum sp. CBA1220 TaxID=1853682 RepID=UPI000F3A901B|nr:molybdenum cofactor guanylyltransferase [Halarchaeum sp. CBA1220]QLC34176.1 molybdenum cofactor guanylyltransferase [Halarchaeum sp. CBA1220]